MNEPTDDMMICSPLVTKSHMFFVLMFLYYIDTLKIEVSRIPPGVPLRVLKSYPL